MGVENGSHSGGVQQEKLGGIDQLVCAQGPRQGGSVVFWAWKFDRSFTVLASNVEKTPQEIRASCTFVSKCNLSSAESPR